MAAAGGPPGAVPGWELDVWYQDLQEVLAAAEPGAPPPGWGAEQGADDGPELDATLAAELLELLGPEEPAGPPGTAPHSPPPCLGTEEAAAGPAAGRGVKRKRRSRTAAGRELAAAANEQRVLELRAHNERLREEIGRLSAEVERTRAALIDRIVNLRRA
ncbi:DDIT3 protein, partial [Podargus strigoides]|nr:DDIT3 protein [Podargus strigoides]